jgi:PAS domain S-box-containing protein
LSAFPQRTDTPGKNAPIEAASQLPVCAENREAIEAELRDFVENVAIPIHWIGPDGVILWANKAELRLLGYESDEYIGQPISAFHVDRARIDDILKRLKDGEELRDYEARLRRKDGSVVEVAITSNACQRNGEFIHGRCVTREIGQSARALELQARLAAIVESSDDAIVSKDLNGVIQSWNRGAERMFGYKAAEVIGRHISIIMPPDRVGDVATILERISRGEHVDHFETVRRAKDGRLLNVSLTVSPVRDHTGRIIGASKIARDVTEQKHAAEVRERLAAIIESADDAILSEDLNGIIQSWNRGAERLLGYTADEVIGKHISMLTPPDRLDEIPRISERISKGESIDHYETKRRAKNGRILTVLLTVSPIRDAFGNVVAASKFARDITELKRVAELQARLAAIVESSDDAILSMDLGGYIQSWNRGAERIFGYTPQEALGQHISMLAEPECGDEIPEILARLRRGEHVDHYRTLRRAKNGRILTVSLTISPIRDNSGEIIGISKIARDVTEQERNERALRAANADLEQFAYSASHDLQEPLRTVAAYTGMLQRKYRGQLGPEADEYMRSTIEGVKRMHQLLKDLLNFTRASMVEEDGERRSDPNTVLAEVRQNLETAIADSGASITSGPLPADVRIHHVHLQQLLQNLIANAIRYRSEAPPQIHIAAERRQNDWLFSVSDNGIGIDPQYKEQIFGIFKRLHSAQEYPGTGMGLAICQRLVQRAHGRIWVDSELGRGSTFFFTIPA